ncbi:MAG TPA: FkbM family methyltransferase [Stellaceae bacterium]|nr:FkbM family methyltransferase [Stellaceae bacterium]
MPQRRETNLVPAGGNPADKPALEAALCREPENAELRARYRSLLELVNRTTLGVSTIVLPELSFPLYFRGGSSDLANFDQIFGQRELSLPLKRRPARILDLGAYVGYASVYLAHIFPEAEIVCVEPSTANFRLLTLNTSAYPRIRRLNGAVWSRSMALAVAGHELGDWGTHFRDGYGEGATPAWSVDDILAAVGWDHADFIKCDIEGGEREVFADHTARWHQKAMCVTVETHDSWAPGCLAAVQACFDEARYERVWSGEVWAFIRRNGKANVPPPRLMLLEPMLARLPLELTDVSEGIWGFMLFDDHSCQLHPNNAGEPPATLTVERDFAGQRRFAATLSLPEKARDAVRFSFELRDGASGKSLACDACVVAPGRRVEREVALPRLSGRHRVILRTEMAEPGGDSFHAWAHWLKPQFM